jgi:hypothetical protein
LNLIMLNKEMSRSLAGLLFACCLAIPLCGQATQAPASAAPSPLPQASTVPAAASGTNAADPLEQFRNFSAVMIGTVLPRDEREGHIYRSGNMFRMEGMESRGYYITDLTTFDTYGLSVMGCASMKQPYLRSFPFILSGHGHKVERVNAGKETIDGHPCQIEEVTYSGGLPQVWKLKFWEAEDLHGFPIKIEAQPGNEAVHGTIRYKDVVLGPQDPTLFIYPKECAELPEPKEQEKEPEPKQPPAVPPAALPQH